MPAVGAARPSRRQTHGVRWSPAAVNLCIYIYVSSDSGTSELGWIGDLALAGPSAICLRSKLDRVVYPQNVRQNNQRPIRSPGGLVICVTCLVSSIFVSHPVIPVPCSRVATVALHMLPLTWGGRSV